MTPATNINRNAMRARMVFFIGEWELLIKFSGKLVVYKVERGTWV
jgi:hypothetical protein